MYPNQYPNQPYNTQPQTLPKKSSATKIIFILMIPQDFVYLSVLVYGYFVHQKAHRIMEKLQMKWLRYSIPKIAPR